ncbi:MAG: histidine phosphatase family protein [Micavibrio aeruginosavorus]|nr:histidine phosphatase family protein [Micavibrio aeruginosavorus]
MNSAPSKPLRFYWIRHAPPVNPGNICYGADMDVDLSDTQALKRQAARLPDGAEWIASPIQRAVSTANALSAAHRGGAGIALGIMDDLREQSFGQWVGLPRDALKTQAGFDAYRKDPVNAAPPGGESLKDLALRVGSCSDRIAAAHPQGGDVVVVAHKGTIRAALHHAAGIDLKDTLRLSIDPLSITIVEYANTRWTLRHMNMTP